MAHVNIGNNRANLILSYNTPYNVSVVAEVCGQRNATKSLKLNYGRYSCLLKDGICLLCMICMVRT